MNSFNGPLQNSAIPSAGFGLSNPSANLNLGNLGVQQAAPNYNNSLGISNIGLDQPVVRPNAYVGLNNFVSVAAHYVMVADLKSATSGRDAQNIGLGMLLFARNTDRLPRGVSTTSYGVSPGPNTVEFKELIQLNNYLETNSKFYPTAADVLAEWNLLGVVKTEVAPTNASTMYGTAPRSRIVNLIVSHRVSVLNYWAGQRIIEGQKLYLIVKKNATGAWTISPWTSTDAAVPPLADIMSDDKTNVGGYVYVGKSTDQNRSIQTSNKRSTSVNVCKSLVSRGIMNQLEVNLGI
jgi:hypothetical protein